MRGPTLETFKNPKSTILNLSHLPSASLRDLRASAVQISPLASAFRFPTSFSSFPTLLVEKRGLTPFIPPSRPARRGELFKCGDRPQRSAGTDPRDPLFLSHSKIQNQQSSIVNLPLFSSVLILPPPPPLGFLTLPEKRPRAAASRRPIEMQKTAPLQSGCGLRPQGE